MCDSNFSNPESFKWERTHKNYYFEGNNEMAMTLSLGKT